MVHFEAPDAPSGSLPDLVYQLLEGSGLTIVILGPFEPSFMVEKLRAGVPYFAQSVALPNGLAEKPGTQSLWAILDGPQICAVLLFVAPGDGGVMVSTLDAIRDVGQFTTSIVSSGDMDPLVARQLAGAAPRAARSVLSA